MIVDRGRPTVRQTALFSELYCLGYSASSCALPQGQCLRRVLALGKGPGGVRMLGVAYSHLSFDGLYILTRVGEDGYGHCQSGS